MRNNSFTYRLCEDKIVNKRYTDVMEMRNMIDVFLRSGRFTNEEYHELNKLLEKTIELTEEHDE